MSQPAPAAGGVATCFVAHALRLTVALLPPTAHRVHGLRYPSTSDCGKGTSAVTGAFSRSEEPVGTSAGYPVRRASWLAVAYPPRQQARAPRLCGGLSPTSDSTPHCSGEDFETILPR